MAANIRINHALEEDALDQPTYAFGTPAYHEYQKGYHLCKAIKKHLWESDAVIYKATRPIVMKLTQHIDRSKKPHRIADSAMATFGYMSHRMLSRLWDLHYAMEKSLKQFPAGNAETLFYRFVWAVASRRNAIERCKTQLREAVAEWEDGIQKLEDWWSFWTQMISTSGAEEAYRRWNTEKLCVEIVPGQYFPTVRRSERADRLHTRLKRADEQKILEGAIETAKSGILDRTKESWLDCHRIATLFGGDILKERPELQFKHDSPLGVRLTDVLWLFVDGIWKDNINLGDEKPALTRESILSYYAKDMDALCGRKPELPKSGVSIPFVDDIG